MLSRNAGLWHQVGRQTLWGRRGPAKTGALWLPLAVVLSFVPAEDLRGAWLAGLALFAASVLRTIPTILANDLCDRAEDAAAGKERWVQQLPGPAGAALVVVLFGVGLTLLLAAGAPAGAAGAYLLASLLGLAYSIPPLRMKCRGLAGLVCYSVCCAAAYALVPAAWFRPRWEVVGLLGALVLLDRWVNLHFHQVLDCQADGASGCATYAVRVGVDAARRTLRAMALLASLTVLALLALVAIELRPLGTAASAAAVVVAVAAWVYGILSRRRSPGASPLVREAPAHYLGLTYAVFWILPPLLFARLAADEPTIWVLFALSGLSSLMTTLHFVDYR